MQYRKIDPAVLLPNPHRNFKINPLDNDQVIALATSYENNEDMGVLLVRPSPEWQDHYEIVYGHHRLDAMRRLDWEMVDCKIGDLSDMQMLTGMISENSTQYGGRPESQMDSIQAMIKTIAYALRICDDNESISEILEIDLYATDMSFQNSKGRLLERGEIGEGVLVKMTGIKPDPVRARLGEMRADGTMAAVLKAVEKRVSIEMKAQKDESIRLEQEAEQAAEDLRKAEAAEAAKLERIAKQQERLQREAAAAKKAADKKRIANQQAQAKKDADEAKRRQELRRKETKRLADEREQRIAAEAQRKADQKRAKETSAKMAEDAFLEKGVLKMFDKDSQREAFRKGISTHRELFTVPGSQRDFAKKIFDNMADTAAGIDNMFRKLKSDHNAMVEAEETRKRKEAARKSDQNKAGYVIDEMRIASTRFGSAMNQLAIAVQDQNVKRWVINKVGGPSGDRDLIKALDYAEASIQKMRSELNIGTQRKEQVIDQSVVASM